MCVQRNIATALLSEETEVTSSFLEKISSDTPSGWKIDESVLSPAAYGSVTTALPAETRLWMPIGECMQGRNKKAAFLIKIEFFMNILIFINMFIYIVKLAC